MAGDVRAQAFFYSFSSRFDLSDALEVPAADADTRARLEQANAFIAAAQWDEAIEILRQIAESDAGTVIPVGGRRYVPVADYCHMRVAALPDEAIALYRGRVDAQAQHAYDDAVARHDAAALARVVDQFFISSLGDEALSTLGDWALERGQFGAARSAWERLIETPPPAISRDLFERAAANEEASDADRALLNEWYLADSADPPALYQLRHDKPLDDEARTRLIALWKQQGVVTPRLAYPQSNLDLAAVRARLVLVSIFEGSLERAAGELAAFRALHPAARGRIGGREVNYAEALDELLAAAPAWPAPGGAANWTSFAGAMSRNQVAAVAPRAEAPLWHSPVTLPKPPATDSMYPSPRVAESKAELLSYYPLVVGHLALVNTVNDVRAYDVRTGKPAWGDDPVIYRAAEPVEERAAGAGMTLGVARFTMSERDGLLVARMGDPLTSRPEDNSAYRQSSYLVCLDLNAEGRLVWPPLRAEDKWAFEGSPVLDGSRLYVALRHGTRPQQHVACYDLRTGRLLWRQFVASAETPARGQTGECTHTLLTLAEGVVYINTNLGAVAALRADSGRPLWIVHYPRAKKGDLNERSAHFYRDLTPCVYDRGRLIVAPSDSESIMAYDAATGLLLWETALAADVVHLLGVSGERLWASGEKLWKIEMATGKVSYPWPEGPAPRGFGRGLLAGNKVYFPTADAIHVFDQRTGMEEAPIELVSRRLPVGNLIPAGDALLVAGSTQMQALGPAAARMPDPKTSAGETK